MAKRWLIHAPSLAVFLWSMVVVLWWPGSTVWVSLGG